MPFLGSTNCHEDCNLRIMAYLDGKLKDGRKRGDRAIGFDCINLGTPEAMKGHWAGVMDSTRELFENDKPWGWKPAVKYYHFVVSPDPRDNVDIDTLRELTLKWATEMFGTDDGNPGRFGSYEVAITYHDDNALHIPHAHVIVNNTNLETGKRLQISNRDNELLPNRLNAIARDMGLRCFDNESGDGKLNEEGRYYTKAERSLLSAKRYSWKQDIANHVVVSWRLARSEGEFVESLDRLGIEVATKVNGRTGELDYIFANRANPERWRVSGYRLGRNYTRERILGRLEANAREYDEELGKMRDNILSQIPNEPLSIEQMDAIRASADEIQQIAFVLAIDSKYNLRSIADYDKRIRMFDVQISRNASMLGVEIEQERAQVVLAKQLAIEKGVFDNVNLNRPSIDIYNMKTNVSGSGDYAASKRKREAQVRTAPSQRRVRTPESPGSRRRAR